MKTRPLCLAGLMVMATAGAAGAADEAPCRSYPHYTVGNFPPYEHEIARSEAPTLDRIAAHVQETLRSEAKALDRVVVVGHAALYGTSDFDKTSEYRASLVAAELRSRLQDRGIDSTGLDIESFGVGTRCPVATNGTQEGRAQNRRVDVWIEEHEKRSDEGRGGRGGKKADKDASRPGKARLTFSPSTVKDPRTGLMFPADMPPARLPNDFDDCTAGQKRMIREAWALAHYYMWRADQVMDWLAVHEGRRQQAWDDGAERYDPTAGKKKRAAARENSRPKTWFGPYAEGRFESVDGAIERVFTERFLGREFRAACKPGEPKNLAQHNTFGRVVFFHAATRGFFGKETSREMRALTVVHELYHPLRLKNGTWVMDTHAFMGKVAKHYDEVDSQKLSWGDSARHYRLAIRNNDNHAYFAKNLGEAIYQGKLAQFP